MGQVLEPFNLLMGPTQHQRMVEKPIFGRLYFQIAPKSVGERGIFETAAVSWSWNWIQTNCWYWFYRHIKFMFLKSNGFILVGLKCTQHYFPIESSLFSCYNIMTTLQNHHSFQHWSFEKLFCPTVFQDNRAFKFWMKFDKKAPKVTLLQTHPQLKKRGWMAKKGSFFVSGGKISPEENHVLEEALIHLWLVYSAPLSERRYWEKIELLPCHCHVMVVI